MTRVMKSYLGAILLNISRIKRVSWRSAGIVMVVANLTRFAARQGGVISVRGRREIRRALELRGQVRLRLGCGLRAHLAFHLAAGGFGCGSLSARGAMQQIFRVQEASVNRFVRRMLVAQKLSVVEPVPRFGWRVAIFGIERQATLVGLRGRGDVACLGLQIR